MPNLDDEAAGAIDALANEASAPASAEATETQKPVETSKTEAPTETNTPKADEVEEDEVVADTQDFSREPHDTETTNTDSAPSQTETETDNTETETTQKPEDEIDWKATLPPPPAPFAMEAPKPDANGNVDPVAYTRYITELAKSDIRNENYIQTVENRALDAAEKILPELKTNPAIRGLVENARVASVLNGTQIDSYEAAKQVKAALGISPEKIQEARAEGARNAKTSITIQKNAQVESKGAAKPKAQPSRADQLTKRLKSGDDTAFAELFELMDKDGKI